MHSTQFPHQSHESASGCETDFFLIFANCLLIYPTSSSSHSCSRLTCRTYVCLSAHSCLGVSFSSSAQESIFGFFWDLRIKFANYTLGSQISWSNKELYQEQEKRPYSDSTQWAVALCKETNKSWLTCTYMVVSKFSTRPPLWRITSLLDNSQAKHVLLTGQLQLLHILKRASSWYVLTIQSVKMVVRVVRRLLWLKLAAATWITNHESAKLHMHHDFHTIRFETFFLKTVRSSQKAV